MKQLQLLLHPNIVTTADDKLNNSSNTIPWNCIRKAKLSPKTVLCRKHATVPQNSLSADGTSPEVVEARFWHVAKSLSNSRWIWRSVVDQSVNLKEQAATATQRSEWSAVPLGHLVVIPVHLKERRPKTEDSQVFRQRILGEAGACNDRFWKWKRNCAGRITWHYMTIAARTDCALRAGNVGIACCLLIRCFRNVCFN